MNDNTTTYSEGDANMIALGRTGAPNLMILVLQEFKRDRFLPSKGLLERLSDPTLTQRDITELLWHMSDETQVAYDEDGDIIADARLLIKHPDLKKSHSGYKLTALGEQILNNALEVA